MTISENILLIIIAILGVWTSYKQINMTERLTHLESVTFGSSRCLK